MNFKQWVTKEQKIDDLIHRMMDYGIPIPALVRDIQSISEADGEGLVSTLRKRFSAFGKRMKDAVRDTWEDEKRDKGSPVYWVRRAFGYKPNDPASPAPPPSAPEPPPAAPAPTRTKSPEDRQKDAFDAYSHHLNNYGELEMRRFCNKGHEGKVWCKDHWRKVDPGDCRAGDPVSCGYLEIGEYRKKFEEIKQQLRKELESAGQEWVASQGGDKGEKGEPQDDKVSQDARQASLKAGLEAIANLRKAMEDPGVRDAIKGAFEQAFGKTPATTSAPDQPQRSKPSFYDQMGSGEKSWYDKLGDEDRGKFDDEMGRSGHQYLNQGDEWWNVAAARAQKAASQGYQDSDANFRWGADFANRQRIRRSMNPDWEKQLQGESLTPGGKLFREWLKKRVTEQAGQSGVAADAPGEVTAPTDPKEIARRKAVNDITSTLMKKNNKLQPGATDAKTVATLSSTDPALSKSDPETQQAVSSFFLKK